MSKKISLSFKETTYDTEIWMAIQNLEEKSQTIKTILHQVLVEGKELKPVIEQKK